MSPALKTLGFDLPITRSPDLFLFFCSLSVLCGQLLMFFKIKFAYIWPYRVHSRLALSPCLRASVVSFGFTS